LIVIIEKEYSNSQQVPATRKGRPLGCVPIGVTPESREWVMLLAGKPEPRGEKRTNQNGGGTQWIVVLQGRETV